MALGCEIGHRGSEARTHARAISPVSRQDKSSLSNAAAQQYCPRYNLEALQNANTLKTLDMLFYIIRVMRIRAASGRKRGGGDDILPRWLGNTRRPPPSRNSHGHKNRRPPHASAEKNLKYFHAKE